MEKLRVLDYDFRRGARDGDFRRNRGGGVRNVYPPQAGQNDGKGRNENGGEVENPGGDVVMDDVVEAPVTDGRTMNQCKNYGLVMIILIRLM